MGGSVQPLCHAQLGRGDTVPRDITGCCDDPAHFDDGGWHVGANSPSNPGEWEAGNEFVSRYSLLPRSTFSVGRVFCKQTLAPATYHFSYFFDTWCELEILILLYHR